MQRKTNDKLTVSTAPACVAQFWVLNATPRQVLTSARQERLIINEIRNYGRILHLTAAGNFHKWLSFVLKMQNRDAVLIRSS